MIQMKGNERNESTALKLSATKMTGFIIGRMTLNSRRK